MTLIYDIIKNEVVNLLIIKKNHVVQKQNILNEMRANNMSLQELRFFSIYLSKINANDIGTRIVRFPLSDFQSIMEIGRVNIQYMKHVTDGLLCKLIRIPTENGGYNAFQIFKKCIVDMDEFGNWYIEIDAHDDALPLMFQFKKKYFSYQLWNALKLKSSNQLRMYEILKQYEMKKTRILSLIELRSLLGVQVDEYKAYKDFRVRVLDSCQKSLKENTDICFSYEPYGKKGKGGKILNLKFNIQKNDTYTNAITLEKFINQDQIEFIKKDNDLENKNLIKEEFTQEQLVVLKNTIIKKYPQFSPEENQGYLCSKYNEMCMRNPKNSRFGYLKKIIELDTIEPLQTQKTSYDIDKLDKFWDKVPTLD